jgi:hypothetical protein
MKNKQEMARQWRFCRKFKKFFDKNGGQNIAPAANARRNDAQKEREK